MLNYVMRLLDNELEQAQHFAPCSEYSLYIHYSLTVLNTLEREQNFAPVIFTPRSVFLRRSQIYV